MINHLHVCIMLQSQIVRFLLKASSYQIVQIYQSVETRKHLISDKLRYKKTYRSNIAWDQKSENQKIFKYRDKFLINFMILNLFCVFFLQNSLLKSSTFIAKDELLMTNLEPVQKALNRLFQDLQKKNQWLGKIYVHYYFQ